MPVRIKWPLSVQVRRAAQALPNGESIHAEVRRHKDAIVEAADRGVPPVGAISRHLQELFPNEMRVAPVRQFVGTAVKALLMDEDFELHQSGIRLRHDPVFTTGSVYRRKTKVGNKAQQAVRDAYARMVRGMNVSERRLLLDVLQKSLGMDEDDG